MKILVIGGSHFLGRHIAEALLAHNHQLTLFNRGKTNPNLFQAVEEIHGDRYDQLGLLNGRNWDVVIDTCGYHPASVGRSAHFLADVVGRYVFISSISVYKDFTTPGLSENSETRDWPENTNPEDNTADTYGARKVLCEVAVDEVFEGRSLHLRPGVLAGPYDSFGRIAYWLERVAKGGDILAPGDPTQPLQLIDARDIATWIIRLIETEQTGVFNAVGPSRPLTFEKFLLACQQVVKSESRLVWLNEGTLIKNKVQPWTEIPLWVPEFMRGLHEIKAFKAFGQGLICRPLEMTLADTWQWMQYSKPTWPSQQWLSPEKEAQLLELKRINLG
ncbi:MAG: NAD-dependent epimerase/dehydratase family protein [Chlamydiales bacterium]|nr:NAD-dependent epimerase/dehydratase family protein [Chlamydiales bacterium]